MASMTITLMAYSCFHNNNNNSNNNNNNNSNNNNEIFYSDYPRGPNVFTAALNQPNHKQQDTVKHKTDCRKLLS